MDAMGNIVPNIVWILDHLMLVSHVLIPVAAEKLGPKITTNFVVQKIAYPKFEPNQLTEHHSYPSMSMESWESKSSAFERRPALGGVPRLIPMMGSWSN